MSSYLCCLESPNHMKTAYLHRQSSYHSIYVSPFNGVLKIKEDFIVTFLQHFVLHEFILNFDRF